MKKYPYLIVLLFTISSLHAQDKFYTKTGKISFDVTAPKSPENVDAVNKAVVCVIDTKTGDLQFSVLMKGFEFDRALMMEHFNENYVESEKFPKTIFKGTITNNASINYTKEGTYAAKVKGKMTMHGETKDIEADGKITTKAGKIMISAVFNLSFAEYKISVPQIVSDKVANTAKVSVDCTLEPLQNK
jgi:polyisoprenoid-binding protein YceI